MSPVPPTPIWFLLARERRLACLQMPKAGCTSMRAALCLLTRPDIPREQLLARGAFARHPEWSDVVPPGDPILEQCFRFTFVRHPYERFASFFRSKIGQRTADAIKPHFLRMGLRAGMVPEEVFAVVEAAPRATLDPHLTPQSYFVFDGERQRVEFIGHLEQLNAGIEEIAAQTGTRLEVPRLNATERNPSAPPREPLSPGLKARLARFYADDFARFGYEP